MHRIDVHKLADDAEFNRFHAGVIGWSFLILIFDGYDLAVAGIALPGIMKEMGVDATKAGFMVSSALFGMLFGSMILGTLGDKIGRRWALSICIFLFSVFTAAAGLATDPVTFAVLRFIAGLGIGGALPLIVAQIGEFAPVSIRARMITISACGYAVGGVLAAALGKGLIETYGWQAVFFAAGAPVILIPFVLKVMPESMPFLLKRKRDAEVREIVKKIAPHYPLQPAEQFLTPHEDEVEAAPVAKLFQDGRGFSTVMFWVAFFTDLFILYALSTWLTKLLALAGYSLGSALTFVLVYNIGAMIGAVAGGWLADRLHIKWVTFSFYVLSVVSLVVMSYGASPALLFLVIGGVGAFTLGTSIMKYAYAAEFYPTSIRSTAVGFASGVGRVGAIVAPILIGWLVSLQLPLQQNFLAIAAAAAIGTVAILLINHSRSASTHYYDAAAVDPSAVPAVARPAGMRG